MNENLFLKKKYNLHATPEAEQAAKRKTARTGEKVPQDPGSRIQNYLNRFKEILDRKDPSERERGIEVLKRIMYRLHVVKPENVPEAAYLLEQRIAREQGHGDIPITEEFKKKKTEQIVNDQEHSLDRWIDYLASSDADYPDWAKYWALRSILEMGKLEKKEDEAGKETAYFKKRRKDTVASFAPLNPRALAMTVGALKSRLEQESKSKGERLPIENISKKLGGEEFQKLVSTEEFSKIYSQFLLEIPAYSTEGLQETRGKWVKYKQGSDPAPLVASLDGYPLEWCTANSDTAKSQLQGGDFYVYYSINEDGKAVIPRLAIRMQDQSIAEVRGIAPNQNVDPYISDVAKAKMAEFPDGKLYEKKAQDMARLTQIDNKTKANQPLAKDDLMFLYEINAKIQGFGYQTDPRIKEIRDQRDPKADAPVVMECAPSQIAWSKDEIDENTKGYIGPLFPGIFTELSALEHIYTVFPEAPIKRINLEIGGQTKAELEAELEKKKNKVSDYVGKMMQSKDFTTQKNPEQIKLIRLKVKDLFSDNKNHTTDEVYAKAEKLGLELCPPEVGPKLRLQYQDQPLNEWLYVGMKPLDADGIPYVFKLDRGGDGLWLHGSWARPSDQWSPGRSFVFCLRKLET